MAQAAGVPPAPVGEHHPLTPALPPEIRQGFGRVLKVGIEDHHPIPPGPADTGAQCGVLPNVAPNVLNHYPGVGTGDPVGDGSATRWASVVD